MKIPEIKNLKDMQTRVKEERENGTLTRGRAIRLHCFDCMGYSSHEVTRCKNKLCPLWEFRRAQREAREE